MTIQQSSRARVLFDPRDFRSDEAETVPSRWLNLLGNLLERVCPPQGGDCGVEGDDQTGDHLAGSGARFETVGTV